MENATNQNIALMWEATEKWLNIYQSADPYDAIFNNECNLCQKYHAFTNEQIPYENHCINCPIYNKTKKADCKDTPFYNVLNCYDYETGELLKSPKYLKERIAAEYTFLVNITLSLSK